MSIGKMKMGYYANAQIESMLCGVPAITYVREQFMTEELRQSGFIFTDMAQLEETIEYYLTHPEALSEKRRQARSSVIRLHDNKAISRQFTEIYAGMSQATCTAETGKGK